MRFEYRGRDGLREARYLIIDWGGALGRWGSVVRRGRWDCEGFASEGATLVQGLDGEFVQFGYKGQRTAVAASGGTAEEVTCFTRALRARLDGLATVGAKN